MIFHRKDAFHVTKADVAMWIYPNGGSDHAAVAYQETQVGHSEEFRHTRSAFIYFILEGAGEWVIEGVPFPVAASDVVIVPPGKKFYFRGKLKQVCVTAPAWDQEHEATIRKVDLGASG